MTYDDFLHQKTRLWTGCGIAPGPLPPSLYLFQQVLTKWALTKGRAALFADTGLGKTAMQLAWADNIARHVNGSVLILAPLAVTEQTRREAYKFGLSVTLCRDQTEVRRGINITNYHRLHHFEASSFAGVVLDESSILKSFSGKTKQQLLMAFAATPYRLACSATPAPNDYLEFGNHAAFLGIMPANEMISRWFINDSMRAGTYRLKGYDAKDFWSWIASWAISIVKPSDLQFNDTGYALPELHVDVVSVGDVEVPSQNGKLFADASDLSATTLHTTLRASAELRGKEAARLVEAEPTEPWLIWCNTNYEADAVKRFMPNAVEIRGSDSVEKKEAALLGFSSKQIRVLLTKPSIAGFGMNWQHCARVVFVGLSYSYEQFYQAIRRTWRYGQTKAVRCYVLCAESERGILAAIDGKKANHDHMKKEMIQAMRDDMLRGIGGNRVIHAAPAVTHTVGQAWTLYHGDCVEASRQLAERSVHFSVFSPPFSNLYIYSDSMADMGNVSDHAEFFRHFGYLIKELYRLTIPGRNCAVHCKDLPRYKNRDGAAGLFDFPGETIRAFQLAGWTYHSRVTIWKDPVVEMQRTKNHGLLYKQLRKDSCASRMGMADYVLCFRKWTTDMATEGVSVPHTKDAFPLDQWQRWASPVWNDIRQTNVLQYRDSGSEQDERHICPLQLDVIERCLRLWSNTGETVLSPFAGIGSEGYEAIRHGRRFIGIELKKEYYEVAIKNLCRAEQESGSQLPLMS